MFRQQGRGDDPVAPPPLPPDLTLRLDGSAPLAAQPVARRQRAHSRDERRLARIDRKVAERDQPNG